MAEEQPGFLFGGNTGLTYEELQQRRAIAAALASKQKGFPKNVGEGMTYLGESFAEAMADFAAHRMAKSQRDAEAKLPNPAGTYTPKAETGPPPAPEPVTAPGYKPEPVAPAPAPTPAPTSDVGDPAVVVPESSAAVEAPTVPPPDMPAPAPFVPPSVGSTETARRPVPTFVGQAVR